MSYYYYFYPRSYRSPELKIKKKIKSGWNGYVSISIRFYRMLYASIFDLCQWNQTSFVACYKILKLAYLLTLLSVLWRCWLGVRKSIRPVETEWWGVGVVICLERGSTAASVNAVDPRRIDVDLSFWSPIYKISYDLSYDYRKFIVRST